MLDLYGLGAGFPGFPVPANMSSIDKVRRIEAAVKADICNSIPDFRSDLRFLPYIQLHEYEGLLFSDPAAFATGIHQPGLARVFQDVRDRFPAPEDINDNADTAPSRRVLNAYPRYRKVLHGTLAARECPHFRDWLGRFGGAGAVDLLNGN